MRGEYKIIKAPTTDEERAWKETELNHLAKGNWFVKWVTDKWIYLERKRD